MSGFFECPRRRATRPSALAVIVVGIVAWGLSDLLAPRGSHQGAFPLPLFAQSLHAEEKGSNAISGASAESGHTQNPGSTVIIRHNPIHTVPIRVDVDMVVVNVTVTGPHDRIVTGLGPSNFEVYDDKVPQQIAAFSTEDTPVSVGLVFDSSGSMANKVDRAKDAALEFFKTSNPQDEFMLIRFNERPELVSDFTSEFATVQDQLITVEAGGTTALLDAIYLGLAKMRNASANRKALLVISDGGDNHSRYHETDIRRAVEESDVEIYVVGVFEPLGTRHRTQEEAQGPRLLADLAEMSGGRLFAVDDPAALPRVMQQISTELRNQYAIGYKPSNLVRDGRWRRVKVKVNPPRDLPRVRTYARSGYYAPTQ